MKHSLGHRPVLFWGYSQLCLVVNCGARCPKVPGSNGGLLCDQTIESVPSFWPHNSGFPPLEEKQPTHPLLLPPCQLPSWGTTRPPTCCPCARANPYPTVWLLPDANPSPHTVVSSASPCLLPVLSAEIQAFSPLFPRILSCSAAHHAGLSKQKPTEGLSRSCTTSTRAGTFQLPWESVQSNPS